jgi:radical SAM superfamily enzyme YgiQ (UPF0313 family)
VPLYFLLSFGHRYGNIIALKGYMKRNNNLKVILCTIPQRVDIKRRDTKGLSLNCPANMGIVSLHNYMTRFGYSADFYDINTLLPSEDEMFNYFKSKKPDVIGISAVIATSYFRVKIISSIIRRASPKALIVVGGYQATSANVLLRKTEVDICVIGDGEKSWVGILDYAGRYGRHNIDEELLKIKGVAFLNRQDEMEFTGFGEPIPGNENPFPDYEFLFKGFFNEPNLVENYFSEAEVGTIENKTYIKYTQTHESGGRQKLALVYSSKGCVKRCAFCHRFCKGYHIFDLKKLDDYLTQAKEKYNVKFILVVDECFGGNKKHSFEVAKLLKKHDMLWYAGLMHNTFKLEEVKFLKNCGLIAAKPTLESGSQKILNIMGKRVRIDDLYRDFMNINECGIFPGKHNICIGMPGENDKTITETGRFLGKFFRQTGQPLRGFSGFYAMPMPGTPLFEYGRLTGVLGNSIDEEEEFLLFLSDKRSTLDNFINLTGEPFKNVVFWYYLMNFEAARTYYNTSNEKIHHIKIKSKSGKIRSTMKLLLTGLVVKTPRRLIPLLYFVLRNIFYALYTFRRFYKTGILKEKNGNKWKNKNRIRLKKGEPLREINGRLRKSAASPKTKTEKNQQILYAR